MKKLSKRSLEVLQALFAENSNLQLPVGLVDAVLEIRAWVEERLKEEKQPDE